MLVTGRILTFDLAGSTGYCYGAPHEVPIFGTHRFSPTGENYGRHQANVRAWLRRMIFEVDPVLIAYEQPSIFSKTTPATIRKLSSYGSTLEEECLREGFNIPVREVNPSTMKLFFANHGKADKPAMVAAARKYGFNVSNDDEADALSIWFLMVEHYGSDADKTRFQQMRFEAGLGVKQKAKF